MRKAKKQTMRRPRREACTGPLETTKARKKRPRKHTAGRLKAGDDTGLKEVRDERPRTKERQ